MLNTSFMERGFGSFAFSFSLKATSFPEHARDGPQPPRPIDRRIPPKDSARGHIADNPRLRREPRPGPDLHVIGDARLAAHERPGPDPDRSRKPRLSRHDGAGPNHRVVPDVHVGVELRAFCNDRGAERARVDGAERADLHVGLNADAPELRDSHEIAARGGRPPKARPPDNGSSADDRALADIGAAIKDSVRLNAGSWTHAGAGEDDGTGAHERRWIDVRPGFNMGETSGALRLSIGPIGPILIIFLIMISLIFLSPRILN